MTDDPQFTLTDRVLVVAGTAARDRFTFGAAGADSANHTLDLNSERRAVSPADVDAVVYHGAGGGDYVEVYADPADTTAVSGLTRGRGELHAAGYSVYVDGASDIGVRNGGVAYLAGTAAADELLASPGSEQVTGPDYGLNAYGMTAVVAYGNGGADRATVQPAPGNDVIAISPALISLLNTGNTVLRPGSRTYAAGFTQVSAAANYVGGSVGDTDAVYLAGTVRADTLTVDLAGATLLTGPGFAFWAAGFRNVTTFGNGGGDAATLYGTAGDDVLVGTPASAYLSGAGYANVVVGFDSVVAVGTAGGRDTAYLADAPGNDSIGASGTKATLSGAGYSVAADGFYGVVAYGTNGGENRKFLGTVSFFLALPGTWY